MRISDWSSDVCSSDLEDAMKFGRLNHIGVATPSIPAAVALYRDLLGAEKIGEAFDLPAQKVRVCFVDAPNSQIELPEPLGEDRSEEHTSELQSLMRISYAVLRLTKKHQNTPTDDLQQLSNDITHIEYIYI